MLNGGYVMKDGYREYLPGDSRLWLELFILAEKRSRNLARIGRALAEKEVLT